MQSIVDITPQIFSVVAKPNKLGTDFDEVLHQRLHIISGENLKEENSAEEQKKFKTK
jgi:hypothetical protein